jgi:hypothetical protein
VSGLHKVISPHPCTDLSLLPTVNISVGSYLPRPIYVSLSARKGRLDVRFVSCSVEVCTQRSATPAPRTVHRSHTCNKVFTLGKACASSSCECQGPAPGELTAPSVAQCFRSN